MTEAEVLHIGCMSNDNSYLLNTHGGSFPDMSFGKESACNVGALGWEDPLEKGKVTHSSILSWRIP